MVYFQTKNPNLGKSWRALQWMELAYFMAILSILRPFGICNGHLVYFPPFWYMHPEKSGNPVIDTFYKPTNAPETFAGLFFLICK
jgi:hypothetical protein